MYCCFVVVLRKGAFSQFVSIIPTPCPVYSDSWGVSSVVILWNADAKLFLWASSWGSLDCPARPLFLSTVSLHSHWIDIESFIIVGWHIIEHTHIFLSHSEGSSCPVDSLCSATLLTQARVVLLNTEGGCWTPDRAGFAADAQRGVRVTLVTSCLIHLQQPALSPHSLLSH